MHYLHSCIATQNLPHCTTKAYPLPQIRKAFTSQIKGMTAMFLSHIARFLRQWRAYDASIQELSRLGDRELADIGISRSDIPRVAWQNAERAA